jgi:hypothetical protein
MKVDRRDVLKLAAGLALARKATGAAEAQAGPLAGRFFDAREMALLDELTELIVPADAHSPGARAANVAAFMDAQLAEKDPKIPDWAKEREEAKAHLAALDGLCREMHGGRDLLAATGDERVLVLTRAAAGEGEAKTPAERAFVWLKGQTTYGYYTSKIGLHDELGYLGNTMLPEFAGDEPR